VISVRLFLAFNYSDAYVSGVKCVVWAGGWTKPLRGIGALG